MFGPRSPTPQRMPGGSVARRARPEPKLDRKPIGPAGKSIVPRSSSHQANRLAVKGISRSLAFTRSPTASGSVRCQGLGNQLAAVGDAVEGDEAAHARPLAGAEQDLVEGAEPVAQIVERVGLADLVDLGLDGLGVRFL